MSEHADELNVPINFQIVANDEGSEEGSPVDDCNPEDATSQVREVECRYEL